MWNKTTEFVEPGDDFDHLEDRYARRSVIADFNKAAEHAFNKGVAPMLLKASISKGSESYKHALSWLSGGGFRIKVLSGQALSQSELKEIALIVLNNESLTRKLISLGWDTLEIHDNIGVIGIKYQLTKYVKN